MNFMLLLLAALASSGGELRSLALPARPPGAPGGEAIGRAIAALPLEEREARIVAEVASGNVPDFLRRLVPVTVEAGGHRATFGVTPDYLAVGSDDDSFLVPLSPEAAQQLADRLDCALPTPRMVDAIHAAATKKLTPAPIPPSPAMTTVPVFLEHSRRVRAALGPADRGSLVAGHKKDVVLARRVLDAPGKVAIYGWHRTGGKPIQPLYAGHTSRWVDYSHGVRLVGRRIVVDGAVRDYGEVLADPELAPLLSDEGVLRVSRYPTERPAAAIRGPGEEEATEVLRLEPGVRVLIDRPEPLDRRPVLLVFYGLPNGNSIEQTRGKSPRPGDDWHFDIQHIAAQTRFLRPILRDRALVVAYLENDLKSWPAWRRKHGDRAIEPIVAAVRARFPRDETRLVLSGHSGGGSLVLGYLNRVEAIPDEVERIALLDANYAYETDRHADKLSAWLLASDRHFLCVLAYDDARALLNGKPFVSPEGGTWGRSRAMLADLGRSLPMNVEIDRNVGLERHGALAGRVRFLLKDNPDRRVLHTVQVERNGFIESLLSGTPFEEKGYTYFGPRAYSTLIRGD